MIVVTPVAIMVVAISPVMLVPIATIIVVVVSSILVVTRTPTATMEASLMHRLLVLAGMMLSLSIFRLLHFALKSYVVGMTYGACHVPSYLSAGVPRVSMARRQEDRLRLEGRLCQQPAGDSAVEGWSRAMKTKARQRLSRQKWADPDKSDRGQGRE
jgi:hypothetical protein